MKRLSIIILFNIMICVLHAQNSNLDYKYSIKISNLSRFDIHENIGVHDPQHNYYLHRRNQMDLMHPVIGFQIKTKRNNFLEFTLNDLRFGQTQNVTEFRNDSLGKKIIVEDENVAVYNIGFNCEYTFVFFKNKDKKLLPSVSVGIAPYFRKYDFSPSLSYSSPFTEINAGLKTMVSPGVTWYMKHRIFLDAKIPLCLNDSQFHQENKMDPSVPVNERKISSYDMSFFPMSFAFKLGIGIKL